MKLSRKICDCAQSPIRKFYPYAVAAQQRGIRIHQLNIGQPDIQTPPAFFEAIEAGRRDVLAYAESPGIPALLEAIRAYYARIGASFETQDILVTTGGSEALLMAMLCILDEGDEVLIPEPYYPNYFTFIRMAGGRVHPIPTSPEDGYRYAERARVEPHITEKTRAILLSNPGNPTGTVLTPAELRLMADIAREHGLYLICDEVYREFIYDGAEPATAGSFRDIDENLILIDSVSKRFSACGARIGALISRNRGIMQGALKLAQARLSVATLDQLGAAALYGEMPYIYISPEGTLADLLTAAHEYGHFVDGYVNCNQTFSIDCSEVFSQALEYLTLGSTSLGFARAAELRQYKLYDSLETFLTQACYYAFECKAYALPDSELTVGKLNELFAECCVDFGLFDEASAEQAARSWIDVQHFFSAPYYVISYCVSNDAALQIYQLEQETPGAGLKAFSDLLYAAPESTFLAMLQDGNLTSPFDENRMQELAAYFKEAL